MASQGGNQPGADEGSGAARRAALKGPLITAAALAGLEVVGFLLFQWAAGIFLAEGELNAVLVRFVGLAALITIAAGIAAILFCGYQVARAVPDARHGAALALTRIALGILPLAAFVLMHALSDSLLWQAYRKLVASSAAM